MTTMNLKSIYSVFALDPSQIQIFEVLLLTGPQKASSLAKQIKSNRTTVYNSLDQMTKLGLVFETLKNGIKLFAISPYEKINLLIQEKENKLIEARQALNELKSIHTKNGKLFQPRVQLFETQEELRQMMKDLLLYENITLLAYWPILNVLETLGPDFIEEFNKKRLANNIKIKVIWPQNQIPSIKVHKFLAFGPEFKREVRIAQTNINFSLGYAIYKNTVRFISSSRENFGFLIESEELAEMLKGQFELIWQISKPLKIRA